MAPQMNPWLAVALAVLTLLGTGGGLVALLTVRVTRQQIVAKSAQIQANADETVAGAVKVLIGGASDLVEPLKRELADARVELRQARAEVAQVRRGCELLEQRLARMVDMIHDPYMTLDRLRATLTVVPEPGNGYGKE
jgi:hypothetical protein